MTELGYGIALVCAGCYLLKLAGLSLPVSVLDHPYTVRATALIPVGLLSALVAVQVLADGSTMSPDARLVGLGTAVGCLLLRVPFLLMLVLAAASTACVRLL